jgi:predicted ATPase/class 3 adenylate cyclase
MPDLPTGTVTFLLSDVESSTRLWEQDPAAMRHALAQHDALIEDQVGRQGGVVVRPRGEADSRFAVFRHAAEALGAAAAVQEALHTEPWAVALGLRVRMALHTGDADLRAGDYYGGAVNRCARLRSIAHGGQTLLSRATHDLAQDALPPGVSLRALGEHRLADLQRPEQVYQVVAPGLPGEFPPLRSLESVPHNLPLQLTSFVGREREMADVAGVLGRTRLLTLTGVGGTGKTRLALQVAADLLAAYPQGVWLVELAPLADPGLVPGAVATALGIAEDASRPLVSTLIAVLRPKCVLLLLDNCEHLIEACAQLSDALLHACARVQILATSREALGIAGETSWPVSSLELPGGQQTAQPVAEIAQCSAVRLFAERAQAVQPRFALTQQNAAVVGQICRRLDGIPLALELAAARLRALSVEQLAARLDQRFRLLTGGSRTALPRQQTLQAAVDWSFGLLSPAEQRLFAQLSVFAGGFSLEAAEAVCTGGEIAREEMLDLLTRLVEKSLVMAETEVGNAERYRLLETLRQYGRERVLAGDEAAELHDRHAAYYLALTERAEPELHGPRQRHWLDHLEGEHDNLHAALAWCLEQAAPGMGDDAAVALETGARMASALIWYWVYRDHRREAREWLDRVLSAGGMGPALRAKVLRGAGWLAWDAQDLAHARALLEQSIALYRDLGDKGERAFALSLLAPVVWQEGKDEQAMTLEQAIAYALEETAPVADATREKGEPGALW